MTTGSRLHLVTPDDWRQVPLDDEGAMQRALDAIVDRQFRGVDDQPLLKRSARSELLSRAVAARDAGGVEMYLSFQEVGGVPLAISLVVTLIPAPPDARGLRSVLQDLAAAGDPGEPVELAAGLAVRRRRLNRPEGLTAFGAPEEMEVVSVDYFLEGPRDTLVLLSFSSPLTSIADALADLFEAVASTVRWSE